MRPIATSPKACVPSTSPPAELFGALARALNEVGASWYLFGAQAALIWGRPRLTADIDVTVRLSPENPDRLVDAMTRAGFALRVTGTPAFIESTRVMPFVHESTAWPVDVVLAGPGLEERVIDAAVWIDLGDDVRVPVIRAEDFIVTKVLAGRPKDREDIHGVLTERLDKLDLDSIRETLAMLESALGVSDLLPAFEADLARVKS